MAFANVAGRAGFVIEVDKPSSRSRKPAPEVHDRRSLCVDALLGERERHYLGAAPAPVRARPTPSTVWSASTSTTPAFTSVLNTGVAARIRNQGWISCQPPERAPT